MAEEKLKTGTTTVGIVCKDGIVFAADRRATAGYIAHKKVYKVLKITDDLAVTTAGDVSEIQLLAKLLKAELNLKEVQTGKRSLVSEAANLLGGLVYSNFRKFSPTVAITGFLLGGRDMKGFYLYEIGLDGSVMDRDDYASDGSGCVFALGVLETLYKKGLGIDEGVKLAVKSVNTAIQRDPNSGNGIVVMTITDKGVQTVMEKELETRLEA